MSTFFSSSLLCPKMDSLSSAASLVRPSLVHLRFSNTSSMGIFSCTQHTHIHNSVIKTSHNQEMIKISWSDPLPSPLSPSRQHQELQASPSPSSKLEHPLSVENNFLNQMACSRNTMGKEQPKQQKFLQLMKSNAPDLK